MQKFRGKIMGRWLNRLKNRFWGVSKFEEVKKSCQLFLIAEYSILIFLAFQTLVKGLRGYSQHPGGNSLVSSRPF